MAKEENKSKKNNSKEELKKEDKEKEIEIGKIKLGTAPVINKKKKRNTLEDKVEKEALENLFETPPTNLEDLKIEELTFEEKYSQNDSREYYEKNEREKEDEEPSIQDFYKEQEKNMYDEKDRTKHYETYIAPTMLREEKEEATNPFDTTSSRKKDRKYERALHTSDFIDPRLKDSKYKTTMN